MFPLESNAIYLGKFNVALIAAPPSPLNPLTPVPAIVLIIPLLFILRIR